MQKVKVRQRRISITVDKKCSLYWVLYKLGVTRKHQPIANPGCGSGLDQQLCAFVLNFNFIFLPAGRQVQSAAVVGRRNTNSQPT
jgi:hypothetical protein